MPAASGTGTLAPGALRYADFVLAAGDTEIWCVQERHDGGAVTRSIVAVPLDGSAAATRRRSGPWSPGRTSSRSRPRRRTASRLAWISWNHPHMPWDGTELRVAAVEDGVPGKSRLLKGSIRESVLAPVWKDNASLYVATDWTGWWNIYELGLSGQPPQALYPADEEFAGPLWQLGPRPFALLGDGRLAVVHGQGGARLSILDPETCELSRARHPAARIRLLDLRGSGMVIAGVAGGPLQPTSVVRIDAATGKSDILRQELDELPDIDYLPVPRARQLEGPYGRVVHALVYPPTSPDATAPPGEQPPYVVWVHGGPTAHVRRCWTWRRRTSPAAASGSSTSTTAARPGYGRSYRERLRRQWGIVDVRGRDGRRAARWRRRARPTRSGWASGAARPEAGPRWPP